MIPAIVTAGDRGAAKAVQGQSKVVKQTRSLIFSEALLTVDDEPILRANAVLKVPREFTGFDSSDILPREWQPKQP